MTLDYKFETNDRRNEILEFLANKSIVHTIDNNASDALTIPTDIYKAADCLAQGQLVERTIQYIKQYLDYLYQANRSNEVDIFFKSKLINFILPYANIETDYQTLNTLLIILYKLSCHDQTEDSSFQNMQFAENITEIIEKKNEYPTIRKKTLELVNNLLKDETIGNNIFHNFQECKMISVLFSSSIIEQEIIDKCMHEMIDKSFKIAAQTAELVAQTAELLGNLSSYCNEEDLSIFAPFYEIIMFYIKNDFKQIDQDETMLSNFLYLISITMALDSNRKLAYSLLIPDIIIGAKLRFANDDIIKYSYDIFYHIAENDGLYPSFQKEEFYNQTRSAIQVTKSIDVFNSIINAIGSIMPYDYENLYTKEIISDIHQILIYNPFDFKAKAAKLILRFFEIVSNDPPFCIHILQNQDYFKDTCFLVGSLPNDKIMYFIDVFRSLIDEKSTDLCDEIRNCQEAFDTLESIKSIENAEISNAADELLNFWNVEE